MSSSSLRRWLGAIALFVPGAAHAHLATTGLGPVYDGISHLLLSIDDVLPVVAMALLAGQNGAAAARRAMFVLPAAWLAGGWAGFAAGAGMPEGVTAVSMLVIGILAALDLRIGLAGITVLAALLGAVHGGLNGAAIAAAGREATALLGVAGAVFVVATLVGAAVVAMRRAWMRIAVRVCGSWIAATGLLLLGWTLSGRAG